MNEKRNASVFDLNGIPKMSQTLPLALQHVVAMIVGCVTPAIIVAGVTGASREDQIILIQAALLISAVATLIQVFPVHKYCGSGLPVIMGASFAYIPMLISLGSRFDLPTISARSWWAARLRSWSVSSIRRSTRCFHPL